jgi:hypothetical protein
MSEILPDINAGPIERNRNPLNVAESILPVGFSVAASGVSPAAEELKMTIAISEIKIRMLFTLTSRRGCSFVGQLPTPSVLEGRCGVNRFAVLRGWLAEDLFGLLA